MPISNFIEREHFQDNNVKMSVQLVSRHTYTKFSTPIILYSTSYNIFLKSFFLWLSLKSRLETVVNTGTGLLDLTSVRGFTNGATSSTKSYVALFHKDSLCGNMTSLAYG